VKLNYANITEDEATIKLYKHIGVDSEIGDGVIGEDVSRFIDYVNSIPSIKNINIRINSNGGSVQDGLTICTSILNSNTPVTTHIDGMALSIAGVIAMCGNTRKMADYGSFMMHNVGGNKNDEVLSLITNSLAKIFEKTSFLSIEKCRELMNKETWMDATECLSNGLIDSITITNNKKPLIYNINELHAFYNKCLTKKNDMIKLTNKLKLSNDASEDSIIEKIESIEVEADTAKAELDSLKSENETLKEKIKIFESAELEKEKIEKEFVLNNAIETGKITAESKEKWVSSPINSVDLKNLFESIKATPVFVDVLETAKIINKSNGRENWTYSDWERKDSAGLLEIKNNNPDEFSRLVSTINTSIKSKK